MTHTAPAAPATDAALIAALVASPDFIVWLPTATDAEIIAAVLASPDFEVWTPPTV